MDVKYHVIIGLVTFYILVYSLKFSLLAAVIISLSSILIDIDHYFWYVITFKDKNPINALKWHYKSIPEWRAMSLKQKNKFKRGVFIFHGLEFWVILFLLSFINKIFLWILIGIGIHMIADYGDIIAQKEPLYTKLSVFFVLKRNKNKRSLGEL